MLYVIAPSAQKIPVLASRRKSALQPCNTAGSTASNDKRRRTQQGEFIAPIVLFRPRSREQQFDVPPLR